MKEKKITAVRVGVLLLAALFLLFCTGYSEKRFQKGKSDWPSLHVQQESAAHPFFWVRFHHRQVALFADDICEMLDALMAGREPENYFPYEDSFVPEFRES